MGQSMTRTPRKKPEISEKSLNRIKRVRAMGDRIREARTKKGLSQKALAMQLGVSAGAVGQWEIGQTSPTLDMFELLCGVLEVTRDWLMTGEESPERETAQTQEEQLFLIKIRLLSPDDRAAFLTLINKTVPTQPGKVGRRGGSVEPANITPTRKHALSQAAATCL